MTFWQSGAHVLRGAGRMLNNLMALMLVGIVRLVAGKDAALRAWERFKA